MIRAQKALDGLKGDNADQNMGIDILRRAIESPLRQIVQNAGYESSVIVNKIADNKGNYGF